MTARERNAALSAAVDGDRARGREPDPVSRGSWFGRVVVFGRELLALDLFTGRNR